MQRSIYNEHRIKEHTTTLFNNWEGNTDEDIKLLICISASIPIDSTLYICKMVRSKQKALGNEFLPQFEKSFIIKCKYLPYTLYITIYTVTRIAMPRFSQ